MSKISNIIVVILVLVSCSKQDHLYNYAFEKTGVSISNRVTKAEVLDKDAFELFRQKGIFDKETAMSLRRNVLEKGGSEEPMTLYRAFRGADPDPGALLRARGL